MATIKLPSYQPPVEQARRPTATSINRSQPREQNLTVSGYNEVVPLVYGVDKVSGPMIAGPVSRGGWAYWGVAISHGPIDGYDKVIIGTDEHEVTATAQTITGDGFTYHLNFYDGTQTSVDANLAEGIEFFGDVFNGVAYVSVKAQGENMSMTNGLVFKIRGKKVLDPRDNTLKFTENPALHLNDFITNSYYGLGREAIGVEALADHCDSSFGGAPRCRTSTVMQSGLSEEAAIDLLATYAEALWAYQGGSVYLVPDAAVDEADIIDAPMQQIFGGSVQLMTELAQDIPSSVTLTYNSDASDGLAGEPVFVSKGEATASTPYLNSSLTLMGVYRRAEAQRRAEQRLARLQIGGRVSFQMFDTGSLLKIGDVIRFPERYGIGGMLLRVMAQPELVSLGVYQIRTEVYDESIYSPSEGVGAVVIPKGGVVSWLGQGAIPSGFTKLSVGKQTLVMGGSNTSSHTVVNQSVASVSGSISISMGGNHSAKRESRLISVATYGESGSGGFSYISTSNATDSGYHDHDGEADFLLTGDEMQNVTTNSVDAPLIICQEDTAPPRGVGFVHKEKIATTAAHWQDVLGFMTSSQRERASYRSEKWGLKVQTKVGGGHSHSNSSRQDVSGHMGSGTAFTSTVIAGEHKHDIFLESELKLISERVNLIATTVRGAALPENSIIGFIGDSVPSGWALCDGSKGTLNLVDKFLSIGEDGHESNQIEIKAVSITESGSHTHLPRTSTSFGGAQLQATPANHPTEDGLHTHEINYEKTIPFTPRHIKLAFIQYVGE